MCGIAGFCRFSPNGPESETILQRMNRALAHRGPDAEGIYRRDGIGLAHRRLSVIDAEGGAQPFVSDDGMTAIVLNGEIYNHVELREELLREGRRFRSRSDTEVVLKLYESEGEGFLQRLRGMFAFAIWDQRKRRLWMARDRLGLKPLYYCWNGDLFVFGSELKALLEHPEVPRAVDERAIDDFFTFGYVPSPRTVYRGVNKLEAGHSLTVSRQGVEHNRYWDLDFTPDGCGVGDVASQRLGQLLEQVVTGQLISDVPVGSLLSGGLDSTAVLGFMSERIGAGVPSFTASFAGTKDEDRAHAETAARHYGSAWHEVAIREPSSDLLDQLAWHFDEPFADPSAVPTYLLCRGARERVAVCLSGDGGDEVFAGYRRYRTNASQQALRDLVPENRAAALYAAAGRLAPEGRWIPKPLRFGSLLRGASTSHESVYLQEMSICDRELRPLLYATPFRKALGEYDSLSVLKPHFERSRGWDSTSQLQYVDFKTYLADGILTKVDRASMANGLEVRVPLLDQALVEFTAGIPSSSKVARGSGKRLMKTSLRGLVPEPILRRRKRGFTPPVGRWLEGEIGRLFEKRVLSGDSFAAGYLDIGEVRRLWAERRAASPARTQLFWAVLVLETWGRCFQ
jgi:asparagine synthase (glutamine-hydrolysing)